jgi:hypothetical protein
MRIQNDLKPDETICEISPNNYKVYLGMFLENRKLVYRYRTDFRTHDKFSKRLYYAFKPLWFLMHGLDWAFLDRMEALSKLSFGFSTLTAYPDAHTETTSVDGYVGIAVADDTFSNIRPGTGTGNRAEDNGASFSIAYIWANSTTNHYQVMRCGIILFDTSDLTSEASIDSAILSLYKVSGGDGFGRNTVGIVGSTPASNTELAVTDYANLGTTRYATDILITDITTNAYNDWTLNATGISNISKTAVTKLGTRSGRDIDNSAPTWGSGTVTWTDISSADQTGTAEDPKLVVTYSVAAGPTNLKSRNGVLKENTKSLNTNLIANVKSVDSIT